MKRLRRIASACLVSGSLALLASSVAHADIPADYKGKPFDPAVAGGPKMPPTVKGGPYTIPGRLDFVNYDLGGEGVAFHTGDHIVKGGTGYRIDTPPTATFSLTTACAPTCPNVWYDTSAALDGTVYPSATTADFSIGAVQNGDYMNFTVNVATTGTYTLSSTWATGNGPPGGEGGDGTIGLLVFSNGTKLATWTAVFPNSNTEADFRHWKAYPNFTTVMLTAGPQIIKLQSGAKHLQLDYVQFDLVGADGGTTAADASAPADDGAAGTGGGGTTGAAGATGTGGTSGGTGGSSATGTGGDASGTGSAGMTGSGTAGTNGGSAGATGGTTISTGAGGAGGKTGGSKSSGCAVAPSADGSSAAGSFLAFAAMALGLVGRMHRRRSRRGRVAARARV
jgi:hypothetical protein